MQTKTLIQSSVNILRITELTKGCTVKVIKKDYNDNKMFYGIVTDLLNSGEKSFIEILLFEKSYSDLKGKVEIYEGSTDIALFAATVEEIESSLRDILVSLQRQINKDEQELRSKKEAYEKAEQFVSGSMQKQLQSTSFEEVTTEQYLQEVKEKKILAISNE